MKISDLPDKRVQNNSHKNAHWKPQKNTWTKWLFQWEIENIRRYQIEFRVEESSNWTEKNMIEGFQIRLH